MIRSKAIARKCHECAGDSAKEVTLCHIFDCPLWEYRTGSSIDSNQYGRRIKGAWERYKPEFNELEEMGIDLNKFFQGVKNPPKIK